MKTVISNKRRTIMKKLLTALSALAIVSMSTGCSTVVSTPGTAGKFAGKALYVTYRHADMNDETKKIVEELWEEIRAVNSVSELEIVRTALGKKFDEIISRSDISDADKVVMVMIKDDILSKVDAVINSKIESNADGVEFLCGVRDGIEEMLAITTAK